jgi:osmotically-inducible protein OsmY
MAEPALPRIRVDYDDTDVKTRVANFLNSRHFANLRGLTVECRHGAVTVAGNVDSFYEKQVALNSCRRVAGVLSLIDRIEVNDVEEIPNRFDWDTYPIIDDEFRT